MPGTSQSQLVAAQACSGALRVVPGPACLLQVSKCCGATVKLGAEQHRLARLLSVTGNAAEMADAKCNALASEVARHHKMLRRGYAQQGNCLLGRSQPWKSVDSSMLRER